MKPRAVLLWALCLAGLLAPVYPPPPLASGAFVQSVTATGAVIVRIDAVPGTVTAVLLDGGGRELARQTTPRVRRRHVFRFDGLAPATAHRFRLESEDAPSEEGRFRTFGTTDDHPVRFAVLGDSGRQPPWVWMQESALFQWLVDPAWLPLAAEPVSVAAGVLARDPEFWLHVGDVVYPNGRHAHYASGFFRPFAQLLRTSPCFAAIGNHDFMDDGGTQLAQNFVLPRNPVTGDERCYSIVDGPLRVIVLDLNLAVGDDHPALAFLRAELSSASEPWLVVASHFPVASVYREEPRRDLEERLIPLCEQHRVDLLLAGHDHNYQRFGEPGRGLVQVVTGGGGKDLYPVLRRPPGLVVAEPKHHYAVAEIRATELTFEAVATDGAVLDRFTIDKRDAPWLPEEGSPRRARIEAMQR